MTIQKSHSTHSHNKYEREVWANINSLVACVDESTVDDGPLVDAQCIATMRQKMERTIIDFIFNGELLEVENLWNLQGK